MNKLTLYAIIALSLTGCFRAADLGQLRREIEWELPEVQYERQIEMSFGPMSVGFARLVTFFVPPSWRVRGMVSGGLGLHRDNFRLYIARPVSNQTRDLDLSLRFSRTF